MDLHRSDEKILDIKDLIVELLHGCKSVILITILFTVLVGCFGVWRAWKNNHFEDNGKSAEERIEEAREKLSDAELQEVEQLYDRYKLYTDYRAQYLEKFNGFLLSYIKDMLAITNKSELSVSKYMLARQASYKML